MARNASHVSSWRVKRELSLFSRLHSLLFHDPMLPDSKSDVKNFFTSLSVFAFISPLAAHLTPAGNPAILRNMAIDYDHPRRIAHDFGRLTELTDADIGRVLQTCLSNGSVDLKLYLEGNLHADRIRMQINDVVLARTTEPIEILTFHWGFRLMRLRPTRPISDLEKM